MNTISPFIRTALDYTVPPNWQLRERVIFDYELFYVKKGVIELTVDDNLYLGRTGDVFLIHPGKKHQIVSIGDELFSHPHVHFDLFEDEHSKNIPVNFTTLENVSEEDYIYFRDDILASPPYNLGVKIDLVNPEIVMEHLLKIVHLYERKAHGSEIECKGLTLILLAHLMQEQKSKELQDNGIDDALAHGEELLRNIDHDITVSYVAKQCGYSRAHFIHAFTKAYGSSPHQYRKSIRMSRASNLLLNSNLPIKTISEMCGYESIYSFSNAFKNWSGYSPSAYRSI